MPRIFVSHAAKDDQLVENFLDLLQLGVNIHPDDVFCSSLPGMNIPTGAAFVNHIKSQIATPEIVILLISTEFLKSQFCNNEVGASWALSLPIYPLIVPPVDYADIRGVLDGIQVSKLNDKEKLNDLRDDLTENLTLTPFRTSHWERKRDKFLTFLASEVADKENGDSTTGTTASSQQVISSTGAWLKLGDDIFETKTFQRHGTNNANIIIESRCPEVDATLARLRPKEQSFPSASLPFAYKNEGGFLRIKEFRSTSEGDHIIWHLDCQIDKQESNIWVEAIHNFDGKRLTPDDIAELKAGRILINNPPPKRRDHGFSHDSIESLISQESTQGVQTDECVVARIAKRYKDDNFLIRARLESVFVLKAASIVESITKFTLCMVDNGIEIEFEGCRPQRYQNEKPETIRVAGRCQLEES